MGGISKHWLAPTVLEIAGLVQLLFGWGSPMIPNEVAWGLVVVGVLLAGYLAYHDLYVTSQKEQSNKTAELRKVPYRRANASQQGVIWDIAETMRNVHGHSDDNALEQDYLDGVIASDLLNRPCTICGDGTPRKEPKGY